MTAGAALAALAVLLPAGPAHAFVFESIPAARWQQSDAALGFRDPPAETFEDLVLADGLTYQVTTPATPAATPLHELPALFAPADDTFGNAFAAGAWEGTHGLLNTTDNRSHTYSDASQWGTVTFMFAGGAARVGFSLTNMQKAATISVNGVVAGAIGALPGTTNVALGSTRNGYLMVSSGDSGPILSVTITNAPGDGWMIDHLLFQRPAQSVMAFLPDDMAGKVHRFLITRDQATPMGSIPAAAPSGLALSPSGELFVASLQTGAIQRFRSPQGAATPGTTFASPMLHHGEEMRFVDDELWAVDSDLEGSTNAAALVRFGFDAAGTATMLGSVQSSLIGANRALLWNPVARELFVSQCCATSSVVRLRVSADRATVTPLQALTGNGLANPHGLVISPFGELLVANANNDRILRFVLDPAGGARPAEAIPGNGLSYPIGLAVTPWGELLVVNQGNNTVSRLSLDSRLPSAPGTFEVDPGTTGPRRIGWIALGPVAAACAPASAPACRGTAPDAGVGTGGSGGAGPTDAGATDAAGQDARADGSHPDAGGSGGADGGGGTRGGGGCGCRAGVESDTGDRCALALIALGTLAALRGRARRPPTTYFSGRKMSVTASASGTSGKTRTRRK